jgi:spore maturation protein CgeB
LIGECGKIALDWRVWEDRKRAIFHIDRLLWVREVMRAIVLDWRVWEDRKRAIFHINRLLW